MKLFCSSFFVVCLEILGCAGPAPEVAPPHAATAPPAPRADTAVIATGRRWTEAFYARRTQELWDHASPDLKKLMVDKNGLDAFRETIEKQLGAETEVIEERVEQKDGTPVYVRVARFAKRPEPVRIVVGVANDQIVLFGVKPEGKLGAAATTKLDYQTHAALRLPFDGAWTVGSGGRTLAQNPHIVMRDQRFAYDFLIRENGSTHRSEGRQNADYFCYGVPIVAPAAGQVVDLVDGLPENVPGQSDAANPGGNYVILDHGNGEFSFLAHLIPGSLGVKNGDRVTSGQVLGRCGNSGHSSEPHLHYHLQNAARFGDAEGLPAQFRDYLADGSLVTRGEPLRGQSIRAQR